MLTVGYSEPHRLVNLVQKEPESSPCFYDPDPTPPFDFQVGEAMPGPSQPEPQDRN